MVSNISSSKFTENTVINTPQFTNVNSTYFTNAWVQNPLPDLYGMVEIRGTDDVTVLGQVPIYLVQSRHVGGISIPPFSGGYYSSAMNFHLRLYDSNGILTDYATNGFVGSTFTGSNSLTAGFSQTPWYTLAVRADFAVGGIDRNTEPASAYVAKILFDYGVSVTDHTVIFPNDLKSAGGIGTFGAAFFCPTAYSAGTVVQFRATLIIDTPNYPSHPFKIVSNIVSITAT